MWVWFPEGPDGLVTGMRRARILKTDDSGELQTVSMSGLKSEHFTEVVRDMPHGLASHAPANSTAMLLALGGRSERAMLIGGQHKDFRQKNLPEGTAVLYDDKGNVIFAKGQNGIAISAKQGKVYVKPADGQNVYLGGDGTDGTYLPVKLADNSPAKNVFALKG